MQGGLNPTGLDGFGEGALSACWVSGDWEGRGGRGREEGYLSTVCGLDRIGSTPHSVW